MRVYLGSDHRGYRLKEKIEEWLNEHGYEAVDLGAHRYDRKDDYVDFAVSVAEHVQKESGARGILLCGSGHGVCMVANRFSRVRSILGFNSRVVVQGREHEDANVLSLPADWVDEPGAVMMVENFLATQFSGRSRHRRRLRKLQAMRGDA